VTVALDDTVAADDGAAAHRPERRCLATGAVGPKELLVRLVVRPGEPGRPAEIVPDIEERLPGRGLWITARRDIVSGAVAKNLFARAARTAVTPAPDLADRIAVLLARRCIDYLGLARRAGQAVAGFEKVREWAERQRIAVLVEAAESAADGRRKLRHLAGDVKIVSILSGEEIGTAFGRDYAAHAALGPGRIAEKFCREAARLAGFRPEATAREDEARLTTDR